MSEPSTKGEGGCPESRRKQSNQEKGGSREGVAGKTENAGRRREARRS